MMIRKHLLCECVLIHQGPSTSPRLRVTVNSCSLAPPSLLCPFALSPSLPSPSLSPLLPPFLFKMWLPVDHLMIFFTPYCNSIYNTLPAARPFLFSASYSRVPDLPSENRALITSLPLPILFWRDLSLPGKYHSSLAVPSYKQRGSHG